ncbi:PhzF family phenazine biosynthesis protein [Streptomyces noursei]|uniref:PhzF family phenazine biosynthesis protein n=1 Tax=Streptomyces noursei TaxID=1971 RepID=UPI0037FC49E0
MDVHIIGSFADRPFTGNPAAVCLLDSGNWPADAWMRQIATESTFSETTFVRALPAGSEADWGIRWFAPLVETALCGHATSATVHALRAARGITGTVRFASRHNGVLLAHGHPDGSVTLDFPAAPTAQVALSESLSEVLGTRPDSTFTTGTLGDLLAALPDEAPVRAASADLAALDELTRSERPRGLIITAPAAGPGLGYDFVSRFFSPADGIPDAPVTGSALTALAPYWSARLGRPELVALQASARTGHASTAVHGDRVPLTGSALTPGRGAPVRGVGERPTGQPRRLPFDRRASAAARPHCTGAPVFRGGNEVVDVDCAGAGRSRSRCRSAGTSWGASTC